MADPVPVPSRGVVVLPSFNSGLKLRETVAAALACWAPVWVVVDASTDGSERDLETLEPDLTRLRVFRRTRNGGKGTAVLDALREAKRQGLEAALVMDADGQHPAQCIGRFFEQAFAQPDAMILGAPIFDAAAPRARVQGRRAGNFFTRLDTAGGDILDSLFGFRVYPVAATLEIMESIHTARRYDFDSEMVVRLYWAGVRPLNILVPVRYFSAAEGGSSYFRYLPDNLLLIAMHTRLFLGMVRRFPTLLRYRKRPRLAVERLE